MPVSCLMLGGQMDLDWQEIFASSVPAAELVLRGTLMYWFLFIIFRFVVRRDVGSVGIADVLLLVIVADASQNAMAGEYTSLSDGVVLVSTLIAWNVIFDWLSFRSPAFRKFAIATSLHLVRDGIILKRNMRREFITDDELWQQLRKEGIESLDEVKDVFLEANGDFSVIKR
ncbi:MAG: hypothetical protein JWP36_2694 [Paucimonas sp.]|nr:hypothetical protein [Paucimonas sp.]